MIVWFEYVWGGDCLIVKLSLRRALRVSVVVRQLGVEVTTFGGGGCCALEVILITGIFVMKCENSCATVWFWPW